MRVITGNYLAGIQILGMKFITICSKDELGFCLCCLGAVSQCAECCQYLPRLTCGDVDVVALQHAVGDVRFVAGTAAKPLDCGGWIVEGLKKGIWEFLCLKVLLSEFGNGLFNFNCIHGGSINYAFGDKMKDSAAYVLYSQR